MTDPSQRLRRAYAGVVVSVAVVSWNTRALLERCLRAVGGDNRLDVHVVDTGSRDGSRELAAAHPAVTLHTPERNIGFGSAVNLVAASTAAPFLLILNADAAPRAGAVDALLAAAAADPGGGAFTPCLKLPDGQNQHSVYPFPTLPFMLAFHSGLSRSPWREGHWDQSRSRRVPWAIAACLLVRRAAFEDVGGFDPDQWLYAEDLDLGWRLKRAGWATRHVPGAVVDHASAASTRQAWGDERTLRAQAATYAWLERRRGRGRAAAAYSLNRIGARARALSARSGWERDAARGWDTLHRVAWSSRHRP